MVSLKKWLIILILILPILATGQIFSPNLNLSDTTQVHLLVTNRGDIFTGRIIEIIDTRLSLLAEGDIPLEFNFSEINRIYVKGEEIQEETLSSDRTSAGNTIPDDKGGFRTQLMFLTSTAFTLDPDKKLYANVDLLWNSLDVGITEHFSAGFGVVLPFMAIPRAKFAVDLTEKVHLGVGTNILTIYDFYELNMATHFFGVATFGRPQLFVNLTGGYMLPVGAIEDRLVVGGLGVGGETQKFVYKVEFLVYQERDWRDQFYTRLFPEIAVAAKSRNKRYEFGVVGLPFFDFPLFPYLSFKSHF
jgi:hypothetical protein